MSFAQEAAQVHVLNTLLPALSQLDEDHFKELLETNAHPLLCARMPIYGDLSTKSWAEYVTLWQAQDKLKALEAAPHNEEDSLCRQAAPSQPSKAFARSSACSSHPPPMPASGMSRPSMPKPTLAEQNLLVKYQGCFKCCKTLVTHCANNWKVQLTSAPMIVAPSTAEIVEFNPQHPDIKVEAAAYCLACSSLSAASQTPSNAPAKSILVNGICYVVADSSSAWRSCEDSNSKASDLANE